MAVASEVQQQQHGQDPVQQHKPCWAAKAWQYARHKPLELAASTLESITLVLVVFVQDLAFKQSIPTCAALLTASFTLHGLAYRAGQCQVWPKVIELAAPVLFYGLTPAAYLATQATYRSAFIIINFWFVVAELVFWILARRNFIEEYLQDWNPKEIWGTPLIKHCANVVAVTWIVCQTIMGLAQVAVVAANILIETNLLAGVMMCYVMQLLPLLWAVVFTFAYPARVRRRWGYKPGVRETCYPPPKVLSDSLSAATTAADGSGACDSKDVNIAGKDADVAVLPAVDSKGDACCASQTALQGCGSWGGKCWLRPKRSGSSMLGTPVGSGGGHSSGKLEDMRVVVAER